MARAHNTITKGKIRYQLNSINNDVDSFTYDWDEHCESKPDCELIYEDKNGDTYVVYKKADVVIGEFQNID